MIFYILGDNGTSAEGGMSGMFSEMTYFNNVQETVQEMLKHYDEWGGLRPIPTWRQAGPGGRYAVHGPNRCLHHGGARNGLIVSWPVRIKAVNQVRSPWHHVIDVAPRCSKPRACPSPRASTALSIAD